MMMMMNKYSIANKIKAKYFMRIREAARKKKSVPFLHICKGKSVLEPSNNNADQMDVDQIHSSSSYSPGQEFLENNIRVKPDLDALGALGDAGWYCIGAILWAMNQTLPTTVTALPNVARNSAGVILTCGASLYWEKEETVATFYCSFGSHETMDLRVYGSNGTCYLYDFIIPFEEDSASFNFTSGAKFVDLHIGWNVKPQVVEVTSQLPQEVCMIQEFASLVKAIKVSRSKPECKWPRTSRITQLVLDSVNKSIDLGFQPVHM